MTTLLLRLQGVMQSWGTASLFGSRQTQVEPSKSGVLGLLCCAIGRDREEDVSDLSALMMGVRVDHEGTVMRDYQTATGYIQADGAVKKNKTVLTDKHYIADAAYLVGLEGDENLLKAIHAALKNPAWPLFLGRKSCPPGLPVYLSDGLTDLPLKKALENYPQLHVEGSHFQQSSLRFMMEHPSIGAMRMDQPIAPFSKRQFGPRFVQTMMIEMGNQNVPESIEN